jgi:hypothetical protein
MNKATSSTRGFVNAMTTKDVRGENGMPTNSVSGSRVVDLFYKQGALRMNPNSVVSLFDYALREDKLLALKSMFYNRDVRGGQGERATFRAMLQWLAVNYPELAMKNLELVPEYGRWDDLFVVYGTPVWEKALGLIYKALMEKNGLCAKWMPRENKKNWNPIGISVMHYLRLTEKGYRKLLVSCTKVIETQMCKNNWSEINYSQVPSVANNKYRKAFFKHDADRFNSFIEAVKAGKTKINSATLFPSDIVHKVLEELGMTGWYSRNNASVSKSMRDAFQVQWNALPDYMPKGKRILPVCDLSGSMNGQPMEVSLALGIYLSERNEGPFKDFFITFSRNPTFNYLSGDLVDRVREMKKMNIAENTDLNKTFKMILQKAVESNLPEDEMPETILIISDMQFDVSVDNYGESAQQMIQRMYQEKGYTVPNIVYWNVRDSVGIPVKVNQRGVALVSGYSPSIMKNILMGEMTPEKVMLKTLNSDRYSMVVV